MIFFRSKRAFLFHITLYNLTFYHGSCQGNGRRGWSYLIPSSSDIFHLPSVSFACQSFDDPHDDHLPWLNSMLNIIITKTPNKDKIWYGFYNAQQNESTLTLYNDCKLILTILMYYITTAYNVLWIEGLLWCINAEYYLIVWLYIIYLSISV